MTCKTCDSGRDEAKVKWNKLVWQRRLAALKRCQPWCSPCSPCDPCGTGADINVPRPRPDDDDDGASTGLSPVPGRGHLVVPGMQCTDPVTGKPGIIDVYVDANGKTQTRCIPTNDNPGPWWPGGCDPSILCRAMFGHHFNEEVKASDFSPQAVEAVIKGYEMNTVNGLTFAVPGSPGWYALRVGGLGVSHDFCIEEVSAFIVDAIGNLIAIPIANVAVAGERIVCDPDQQGFWQHAIDSAVKGNPAALDITPFRCKCPPSLCTDTPARGSEFIFVNTALPALVISARVTRGDWLKVVDTCVPAIGNRIGVPPQPLAVDPGDVLFLP